MALTSSEDVCCPSLDREEFWGRHTQLGTLRGFGPRFLGRNLRPSSPCSQIMKLSPPNGRPVRSHRRKASGQA